MVDSGEKEGEVRLTEEKINSIREAFNHFVHGEDKQEIPVKRLGDVMRACGYSLKQNELEELIEDVDIDESGYIDFDEFLPLMEHHIKKKEEEQFYKNLFRILDKKKKGFIPIDDLRYILMGLKDEIGFDEEDVDEMCRTVDDDGNGEVSFEEFLELMTTE